MDISNLLTIYDRQLVNLKQLLGIVTEKRNALISSKYEDFEIASRKEEKVLMLVQTTEKQRGLLIESILGKHFPNLPDRTKAKLSTVLRGLVPQRDLERLSVLEAATRAMVTALSEENSHNLFLLHHLKTFYNDVMQALIGNKRAAIVDRKV